MSRRVLLILAVAAAAIQVLPAQTPAVYRLPAGFSYPEGVAFDGRGTLYTASAETGAIARIATDSGAVEVFAQDGTLVPQSAPIFPGALGMKLDDRGRLWIAGGAQAGMFVVDTGTGRILKAFSTPTPASLINDLVIVGSAVYFTDTKVPVMWRVRMDGNEIGELERWREFAGTPLQYDDGLNLNGIAATPDGRTLVTVQMDKGLLFRIDVATGAVTRIDTGGADLSGADGLVLEGTTLYVVRQTAEEIATVRLSSDLARGEVVRRYAGPGLAWPATAVRVGDELVVVNTQFNAREGRTATSPFTLLRVPLSALAAS